jgi:hypothetical protein
MTKKIVPSDDIAVDIAEDIFTEIAFWDWKGHYHPANKERSQEILARIVRKHLKRRDEAQSE